LLKLNLPSFAVSALTIFYALVAFAQTTANISGTVHDATGAVLHDVQITVRNLETGVTRTVRTGDNGRFLVPGLAVGRYLRRVRPLIRVRLS
jgi:hypothetical protein